MAQDQVNADACAREWLQYQGNCYGYFESKLTWHEAEIECQSYHRGAHLASVLTVAETLVVADHISAYQAERSSVWIGLHDIRHNGKWRWSDESVYNYKAWALGSHNNQEENGFCVELLNSVNGAPVPRIGRVEEIEERPISHHKDFTKWKAVPCHKLNAYLCKHEL
ncbi:regenerating islet-derived protein 4-like [Pogona vitticeps]